MIRLIILLLLISSIVEASELRQQFKSPAFNGQGFSSHALTIENLTFQRKQELKAKEEAAQREADRNAQNTNLNKFLANFESRVYAELSKQLSEKLFGENPSENGTISILGNTIEYTTTVDTITLNVTAADGTKTTLEVPIGSFAF